MYIKSVRVKNFRVIRHTQLQLRPGLNILIGPNNVGKTTFLVATDYVLNPFILWWRRDVLCELDFWRGHTDTPIQIEVLIGCDREQCVHEKEQCPRLETTDASTVCPFTEYTVTWDNVSQRIMTADKLEEIRDDPNKAVRTERAIRLLMQAQYQPEGYAEVRHSILDENGDEWHRLSQPMKEWIGERLLTASRDPVADCRLQFNSLLSRALGDTRSWRVACAKAFREELDPIVRRLSATSAMGLLRLVRSAMKDIERGNSADIGLGVSAVRDYDITRQIQLCRRRTEGDDEWEVPFAREGRGVQNLASLALGIQAQKAGISGASVLLLEEPEQNLEPQMQRSAIRLAQALCGAEAQVVMSTHSPYVLSPLSGLDGVQRLSISNDGILTATALDTIRVKRRDFLRVRKGTPHDAEILEALFSPLVVVWEGDCEAGFYPTLMRLRQGYPAEWLSGINGGDGSKHYVPKWFKEAGYTVVVVLDGDDEATLGQLAKENIPFIALPPGQALERVAAETLQSLDDHTRAQVLIKTVGANGVVHWKPVLQQHWPTLHSVFEYVDHKPEPLSTDMAIQTIAQEAARVTVSESPTDSVAVLKKYKGRREYEALAEEMASQQAIPPIADTVLGTLEDIWDGSLPAASYQVDKDGTLRHYGDATE